MNVDMPKNLTYAFCTIDGRPAIAVQKRERSAERFNDGLEAEYRFQIGPETWGDNKVDNKVDNNARGDIKVDNKVDNKMDPYNHPVQHSHKIRTTPAQDPYNIRAIDSDKAGHWEFLEK